MMPQRKTGGLKVRPDLGTTGRAGAGKRLMRPTIDQNMAPGAVLAIDGFSLPRFVEVDLAEQVLWPARRFEPSLGYGGCSVALLRSRERPSRWKIRERLPLAT